MLTQFKRPKLFFLISKCNPSHYCVYLQETGVQPLYPAELKLPLHSSHPSPPAGLNPHQLPPSAQGMCSASKQFTAWINNAAVCFDSLKKYHRITDMPLNMSEARPFHCAEVLFLLLPGL